MSTIGLVTPTYRRDFDLCALLCESVDRHLSSYVQHYLIVADDELPLFDRFNGPRRVVVPSSHLLPAWLKPLPRFVQQRNRRYWWSLRARPVSGRRVQQLLKIGAAKMFQEERFCLLDSDIVFFRRFDLSMLLRPRRAPLFNLPATVSASAPLPARQVRMSHRLLGLGAPSFPATDFTRHIAVWDRCAVQEMIARIETITGIEWVEALCRARDISEFMLYGTFVQNSPLHMAEHFSTSRTLCLGGRVAKALDSTSIETMLRSADDDHVAFLATAFPGTPLGLIRSSLAKFAAAQKQAA